MSRVSFLKELQSGSEVMFFLSSFYNHSDALMAKPCLDLSRTFYFHFIIFASFLWCNILPTEKICHPVKNSSNRLKTTDPGAPPLPSDVLCRKRMSFISAEIFRFGKVLCRGWIYISGSQKDKKGCFSEGKNEFFCILSVPSASEEEFSSS